MTRRRPQTINIPTETAPGAPARQPGQGGKETRSDVVERQNKTQPNEAMTAPTIPYLSPEATQAQDDGMGGGGELSAPGVGARMVARAAELGMAVDMLKQVSDMKQLLSDFFGIPGPEAPGLDAPHRQALDRMAEAGPMQREAPELADSLHREMLASALTGMIGDIMVGIVGGVTGEAMITPLPSAQVYADTAERAFADIARHRELTEMIEQMNFELSVQHERDVVGLLNQYDQRLDAHQQQLVLNYFKSFELGLASDQLKMSSILASADIDFKTAQGFMNVSGQELQRKIGNADRATQAAIFNSKMRFAADQFNYQVMLANMEAKAATTYGLTQGMAGTVASLGIAQHDRLVRGAALHQTPQYAESSKFAGDSAAVIVDLTRELINMEHGEKHARNFTQGMARLFDAGYWIDSGTIRFVGEEYKRQIKDNPNRQIELAAPRTQATDGTVDRKLQIPKSILNILKDRMVSDPALSALSLYHTVLLTDDNNKRMQTREKDRDRLTVAKEER